MVKHMLKNLKFTVLFSSALACTLSIFSIELFETARFTGRIATISCQGQPTKCHLNKCKPMKIMWLLFVFVGIVISKSISNEDNPQNSGALRAKSCFALYIFICQVLFQRLKADTLLYQQHASWLQTGSNHMNIFFFGKNIFAQKAWRLDIRVHIHSADPPDFDFLNRKLVVATPTPKMRLYKILKWYQMIG